MDVDVVRRAAAAIVWEPDFAEVVRTDAFTLVKGEDGLNRLIETEETLLAARRCDGEAGPDDRPCTAEIKD